MRLHGGAWAFVLAATLVSCESRETREATGGVIEVRASEAHVEEVEEEIALVGSLEPAERILLSAQTGGIVAEVRVDFGDPVEAGELLGSLEPRIFELRVEAARAERSHADAVWQKAREDHRRAARLREQDVVAAEELDRAQAALRVAKARRDVATSGLAIAEKHLRDARLLSPVSGMVARRLVNVGEFVAPNTPLLEIIVASELRLRLNVPERFAASIHDSQRVLVEVGSRPGEVFSGSLSRIAPNVDPDTRTLLVEAGLPNEDRRLRPGQFAEARIPLGVRSVVVVPRSALATSGGGNRVFVIDRKGFVEVRPVVSGRDLGDAVVIVEGVASGERVVTSHLERLAHGARVRVSPDGAA